MKYLPQICIIILFSFLGEVCHALIPAPVPASIYGMVLMFAALALKIVPIRAVKETGSFLTGILPVLFVAPIVGLMDHWVAIRSSLLPIAVIIVASTIAVFAASGRITQRIIKKRKEDDCHE